MSQPSIQADARVDGGDLDCGSGLLLILRNAIEPLRQGGVLELVSREVSVKEDLPAWCRMVGHMIVATHAGEGRDTHYFLRKGAGDGELDRDLASARNFEWKVRAAWSGGMKTKIYARNHSFDVGQPASFETSDDAPAAVEMLLGALGGCLVSGFAWRLSQRKLELRAIELSLAAKLVNVLVFLGVENDGHSGVERITGTLYVDADGNEDELSLVWRETFERSPVAQSILRGAELAVDFRRIP